MKDTWWVNPGQLDEQQRQIISLPINRDYLIFGPPGSGKTNLLLLRANYLAKRALPNIAILVFTRALREFMVTGAHQYSFSDDKIQTSHQWMLDIVRQYDGNVPNDQEFLERRLFLIEETNRVIERYGIRKVNEVILLDEAQDYLPEEIELFKKVSGRLFAVADIKQKIYDGKDPIERLRSIVDESFELRKHYRNGLQICQLADGLVKDTNGYVSLSSSSNYNEEEDPSSVSIFKCSDINDQCMKIHQRLKDQIRAYPDEFIGVLCPLRDDVRIVGEYFLKSDIAPLINLYLSEQGQPALDRKVPIVICTIHSAKGLEFRSLHLASFEYIKKFRKQRMLSFMATTRVKTSLSIYHTGNLPPYYEQAVALTKKPPREPTLNDVFGIEDE